MLGPMRTARIIYHLERAAAARAEPKPRPGVNPAKLEAYHLDKAAELIAQGLAQYANLAQDPQSKYQRRLRRRRGGIDARSKRPGAGRGRKGELWGVADKSK